MPYLRRKILCDKEKEIFILVCAVWNWCSRISSILSLRSMAYLGQAVCCPSCVCSDWSNAIGIPNNMGASGTKSKKDPVGWLPTAGSGSRRQLGSKPDLVFEGLSETSRRILGWSQSMNGQDFLRITDEAFAILVAEIRAESWECRLRNIQRAQGLAQEESMRREEQERKQTNLAERKAMAIETPTGRDHQATKGLGRQKNNKKYDAALRIAKTVDSPKEMASVVKLLEAAHKDGDRRATYALGTWYFHGKLFDKNEKNGFLLMLQAADSFIPDACFDVAVSYETGKGVRKNIKKAGIYYLRAMMLGEKQSIGEVGRLFYWGIGFQKNRDVAKELLNFRIS